MTLKKLGGSKSDLIERMAKKLFNQKTTTIARLEEKVMSYFEKTGLNEAKSNHQQISTLYGKYFNAIDVFNKYVSIYSHSFLII